MNDDALRLLLQALSRQFVGPGEDPRGTVAILMSETVKFRDKLKKETGRILTVVDARNALDALEAHLGGQPWPDDLTIEQKALARIYIDRMTLFRK